MFFTADQLVAHAVGDYIMQSHWMAKNKGKDSVAALIHAATYTLPFLLITLSLPALALIFGTHFIVDRFRLARFLVWLKNGPIERCTAGRITPAGLEWQDRWKWKPVTATGYPDDTPPWLAIWLTIIADNIIHVICNAGALAVFT